MANSTDMTVTLTVLPDPGDPTKASFRAESGDHAQQATLTVDTADCPQPGTVVAVSWRSKGPAKAPKPPADVKPAK